MTQPSWKILTLDSIAALSFIFLFLCVLPARGADPASKYFYDEKGQIIREEVDSTGSGRTDTWITYKDGIPVLQAVDTNKDGKPDTWYHLTPDGQVANAEKDLNGDGKPDVWMTYQQGVPVKVEQDLNFDGQPDKFIHYKGGKPVMAE